MNCDFKWIQKDRHRFFEGDVMLPLVETILVLVPLNVKCVVAGLHSSGILACSCFVLQLYGNDRPSCRKQGVWHRRTDKNVCSTTILSWQGVSQEYLSYASIVSSEYGSILRHQGQS